jgi:hypothetical protein
MVIGGSTNRGYVFRFEAEGHKPFVTRAYQADEGEVRLDVLLQPAKDIVAFAYGVDGKAAGDAQVAVITPGTEVHLVPGGFAGDLGRALAWLRRTGADGSFVVPEDDNIQRVVIASPGGYAEITVEDLRKARAVQLGAWSRINGILQSGGQPVPNSEVRLVWSSRLPALSYDAPSVRTDGQGRFAFVFVPPGSVRLFAGSAAMELGKGAPELDLKPGEISEVILTNTVRAQ